MNKLYLVVPCYNEEEVLPETSKRLVQKMQNLIQSKEISEKSKIIFVDDGGKDKTWEIIEKLHSQNNMIQGLKLSRNQGHQNALFAGLMTAKEHCDIAISMDADLQDDIDAVDRFIEKYKQGCDVVYGVRSDRAKDSVFKRGTAQMFYKFMSFMGADIVYNHADYRLMSKRALEGLSSFKEVNLFLRGIVPLVGFKSDIITYERGERFAGESKYPLKKMLSFAFDGITSFSVKPIKMITGLGIIIFLVSLLMLLYFLIIKIMGRAVEGWSTLVISIWALGGIQLFSLGIVGEYIGKIYKEVKHRPLYLIETYLDD